MQQHCVLVTARGPDPKLAKAALAPFHAAKDGTTSTSASGFVLLHGDQPVVVTSAAALAPLLQQRRRQEGPLAGVTQADLVRASSLQALMSSSQGSEFSLEGSTGRSVTEIGAGGCSGDIQAVELRLAGLAELPGVRQALLRLLAAPSAVGPRGWQLGWLLHQPQLPFIKAFAGKPDTSSRISSGAVTGPGSAPGPAAVGMLELASHAAVLAPASQEGIAALCRVALPWPCCASNTASSSSSSLVQGQPVMAVGAPFGALSPRHFHAFVATGIVSAAVPGSYSGVEAEARSSSGGSGSIRGSLATPPQASRAGTAAAGPAGPAGPACGNAGSALLLADLRCSPGMEGGPVFACRPLPQTQGVERRQLAGMLLPPLKAPSAHVEVALLAPAAAVAAAAAEALAGCPSSSSCTSSGSSGSAGNRWGDSWQAAAAAIGSSQRSSDGDNSGHRQSSGAAGGSSEAGVGCQLDVTAGPAVAPAAIAAAMQGVVALSTGSGWATGAVISKGGHILTNAHLLQPPAPAAVAPPPGSSRGGGGSGRSDGGGGSKDSDQLQLLPASQQYQQVQQYPPVQVFLPGPASSSGGSSGAGSWAEADVLHVFQGPLDLAVLQLRRNHTRLQRRQQQLGQLAMPAALAADTASAAAAAVPQAVQPLTLARAPVEPGQAVCVAGFPAISPRACLGPLITAGNVGRVVCTPGSQVPAMLLTTAAVHSGASGGAVLDGATGQLVGLVTSNAKHSSRSGSGLGSSHGTAASHTVLPHLNFSIPAEQLLPVVHAAELASERTAHSCSAVGADAEAEAAAAAAAGAALACWQAVDAAASSDRGLQQVWQLDRQQERQQQQGQGPQQMQGGGSFGGAPPPAKLLQFLQQMKQQELQGQQGQGQKEAQQEQQQDEAKPRAKL